MRDRTPFHFALTFTKDWMLKPRQVTLYDGCGNCCDSMTVVFDEASKLIVERKPRKSKESPAVLKFHYASGKEVKEHTLQPDLDELRARRPFPMSAIEEMVDNLERVGPEEWFDTITGQTLSFEEVLLSYGDYLPWRGQRSSLPDWLSAILHSISIHFIQTQRLLATSTPKRRSPHSRVSPAI